MALREKFDKRASSILPSDNSTVIRFDNLKKGITQSEMGVLDNCAEQWYLGYNHMLRKRGTFAWPFVYGDGVHATLEKFYQGEEVVATLQLPSDVIPTQEQEYELKKWQTILQVQMERYWQHYADDLEVMTVDGVEEIFELEFEGVTFTGKLDLRYRIDGDPMRILMDHKSYNFEDTVGYDFRFQFMFYWWLTEKVTDEKYEKFVVNGIKKPQLRQGQNESLESFAVRIKQDMIQVPEKYFHRVSLPYMTHSMEHFERRVLRPKLNRMKLLTQESTPVSIIESLARNQNSQTCVKFGNVCQFLPICQHGFKREGFQYVQRTNKHEELIVD